MTPIIEQITNEELIMLALIKLMRFNPLTSGTDVFEELNRRIDLALRGKP